MPFNEKGEFIRAERSQPQRTRTRRPGDSLGQIPPPNRPRITSSDDRPPQPRVQAQPRPQASQPREEEDEFWVTVAAIVFLLAVLAGVCGLIWYLFTTHLWILIGLGILFVFWVVD